MDQSKKTNVKSSPNLLAMCLGACCVLMGLALIGAYVDDKDTHLKGVAMTPQPTTITNNNYHVNGTPTTQQPDLPQMPQVKSPSPSSVAYVHQPQTQTVAFQASPEPVVQQKIIYVEQPRPEPVPDTTIVIYKPEVRQAVHKIVVIDERFERLKSEHEARMREWKNQIVVVR